jgi:NAD(P)-dependent dehydrogenase (short-subunit alcohol dehydrogenase family)
MNVLTGKTAVITGAASGIGLALAQACGAEGMRVALIDLAGARLDEAVVQLRARGVDARAFAADVSNIETMRAVAAEIRAQFGAVHLLCNNAGIAGLHRRCWNFGDDEWQRLLDINLRGVINGLQAFLPQMVDQPDGHVVNTASMAGLIPTLMNAPYCASKFAIVGISETLALDLRDYGSRIGVTVLCPGLVKTAIGDNRSLQAMQGLDVDERVHNEALAVYMQSAIDPAQVAQQVLTAVRERRFYVLTHPEVMPLLANRQRWVLEGGEPTFPA